MMKSRSFQKETVRLSQNKKNSDWFGMYKLKNYLKCKIRNVQLPDIKQVYKLLMANRPYVGLNSRYTYFLLAKDFSGTCVVAEQNTSIIGFSSGYVPPGRPDTFFNWEVVVHKDYRG